MNKQKLFVLACVTVWMALPLQAGVCKVANAPDSVYLFSYAQAGGQSGLLFAWSRDGKRWLTVADGYSYLKSDFGPWGSGKKMYSPMLVQSKEDDSWHCIWSATENGQVMAHAASDDLLTWKAQSYFYPKDCGLYQPVVSWPVSEKTVVIDRQLQRGWVQRVPYVLIERLTRFADHKRYRQTLYDECMADDTVRFAGLDSLEAVVRIHGDQMTPVSSHLIGIFFEDINYAADGGLYAELVQNRDFEYASSDYSRRGWDNGYAWSVVSAEDTYPVTIGTEDPIHENNPHYAILHVPSSGACLLNVGFDGIVLKKGEHYDFSCFARTGHGGKGGEVVVCLIDKEGHAIASAVVRVTSKNWKKYKAVLTAENDVPDARLCLVPSAGGTYHFDMVSLFPQKTFKGRKNGLRADLAQTLAELHPRFVRFPGGCVAHGDGIDNMYDWKGSIGPLEARKPLRNLWGYHQTRGLGYFEYFLFCEDIGAEPVPVVAAGVPCQNSSGGTLYGDDELTRYGQQCGIPMDKMPAYVQDVLDLIEYANGDARKTEWGKKRAEAGHPEPFHLKYIGIGNEDLITHVFEERFTMIYNAVRERYPEITVIGTVGPFYEGTDYDEGWRLANRLNIPMVDEHYYVTPGWFIHNQDYYDRYDRSKSKVYLGEYAAHLPGRFNNMETALSEALYLTSIERNADVVTMTSYAPLLAKEGYTQWNPDLIYFNNQEVKPTVSYYTQQLFGQNMGNNYVASTILLNHKSDAIKKRIGVSVVKDDMSGDYIVKLVNLLPVEVNTKINMEAVPLVCPLATTTVLKGTPSDKDAKPVTGFLEIAGTKTLYTMPPYSFTVIRMKENFVHQSE